MTQRNRDDTAQRPLLVARKAERPQQAGFLDRWLRRPSGAGDAQGAAPLVTYHIVSRITSAGYAQDQRFEPRRRTKLRAGKILDTANRFLADVVLLDRSAGGLRLRLVDKVEPPRHFHFFDEESETIFAARLVWRNGVLLGAQRGAALAATPRLLVALKSKFYAMRD